MPERKDGCVRPAGGLLLPASPQVPSSSGAAPAPGGVQMLARVGGPAVDFEANAFVEGEGFKPVKLSDHKGKWIVLCFYPGDFTFV